MRPLARTATLVTLATFMLPLAGCYVIAGAGVVGAVVGGASAVVAKAPTPAADAGAAVVVRLTPAGDLEAIGIARDSLHLRGVRSVLGRVTAARADTLWVALAEVRRASGCESYPAFGGPVAPVVRGPGVTVQVLSGRADDATTLTVGAALGAALGLAGMLVYCTFGHQCQD